MKRGPKPKKVYLSRLDKLKIPFSIFRNSKLTQFEALVLFLKDKEKLTFKEISLLLDKDQRNIWTIYSRATKKLNNSKGGKSVKK